MAKIDQFQCDDMAQTSFLVFPSNVVFNYKTHNTLTLVKQLVHFYPGNFKNELIKYNQAIKKTLIEQLYSPSLLAKEQLIFWTFNLTKRPCSRCVQLLFLFFSFSIFPIPLFILHHRIFLLYLSVSR